MNKITLVFLLSCFLMACSDQNQKSSKVVEANNEIELIEKQVSSDAKLSEDTLVETNKSETVKENEIQGEVAQLSCLHLNNQYLVGFNDSDNEPKCESLNNVNSKQADCKVSENAFGGEIDPLFLENEEKRIFVFQNLEDCNRTLEIRNSNAP